MWFVNLIGGLVGTGIVLVCVVASTYMAGVFGYQLGTGEHERYVYAAVGSAVDMFKPMLPVLIGLAWAKRQKARVAAGVVMFIVFTAYSLTSSFGLTAIQRATKLGSHTAVAETVRGDLADVRRLEGERSKLGEARAIGTVEADLRAARWDRKWAASDECRKVEGKSQREFCQRLQGLEAELATAKAVTVLNEQITIARAKLSGADVAKAAQDADPQAKALSVSLGVTEDQARAGVGWLAAIIIELGSGFGPFVLFGHHGAPKREDEPRSEREQVTRVAVVAAEEFESPVDALRRFERTAIRADHGGGMTGETCYAGYVAWCEQDGIAPMSQTRFGREISLTKTRKNSRVWYPGVAFVAGGERPQLRLVTSAA